MDWAWKVGILHSIGECAFQVLGDKIRRVTIFVNPGDGRIGFVKNSIAICADDPEPQYSASLVLEQVEPKAKVAEQLALVWSGLHMVGRNGT